MDVYKIKFVLAFLVTSFLPVVTMADADIDIKKDEVIQFLHKRVLNSVAELGEKIRLCAEQKKPVLLDKNFLETINAKRNETLSSIFHLSNQNDDKCEKNSRLKLAYDLGVLKSFYRHFQMDIETIDGVNSELIFPSMTVVELSINYSKFPDKLKSYLEQTIGEKPFDLIKTLEISGLSRTK